MFTERKYLINFMLVLFILVIPVLKHTEVVSAQANGSEIMDQLLSEAAAQNKTLGGLAFGLQYPKYPNMGDMAVNLLLSFLSEGVSTVIPHDGKEIEIKISPIIMADDSLPELNANILLTYENITETGKLTIFLNNLRNFAMRWAYLLRSELREIRTSSSNQLAVDLTNLLSGAVRSGKQVNSNDLWSSVWHELSANLNAYPAISQTFSERYNDLFITCVSDSTDASGYLAEIFSNINSFASLIDLLHTLNVEPQPLIALEPITKKIQNLQQNAEPVPPQPDQPDQPEPETPAFFNMLFEQLPATGFSAFHVTPLRERPQSLAYGTTGLTLQIPVLDVMESVISVPVEDGSYPVEWLDRNIGLLEGSALPGEGITVLTGHNHLNTMEAGPFVFIGTLEYNDRLFITNENNDLQSFKVYANYKVSSREFVTILDDLKENSLVLITCEDEAVEGGYVNRRIIFAEPI